LSPPSTVRAVEDDVNGAPHISHPQNLAACAGTRGIILAYLRRAYRGLSVAVGNMSSTKFPLTQARSTFMAVLKKSSARLARLNMLEGDPELLWDIVSSSACETEKLTRFILRYGC